MALVERLAAEGAVPRFVGRGSARSQRGRATPIEVDVPLEAAPSVLFDAWSCRTARAAAQALRADGRALEFIKDQYRHCKPILVLGDGQRPAGGGRHSAGAAGRPARIPGSCSK